MIGCRVMLLLNLQMQVGLVKETMGTIRRKASLTAVNHLILLAFMFLEFDNYSGSTYDDNLVPKTSVTKTWKDGYNFDSEFDKCDYCPQVRKHHTKQNLNRSNRKLKESISLSCAALSRVKT